VIQRPHHGPIAERIQPGSDQRGPTKAIIGKDQIGIDYIVMFLRISMEARELGGDGAFLDLTITGHSGVEGDLVIHRASPLYGGGLLPRPVAG
jgi:hypothetical protein